MLWLSVAFLALKRLWNNKLLTLCSIAGLLAAVTIISAIPLYTDAANFKVLKANLAVNKGGKPLPRPAFAFMYYYLGTSYGFLGNQEFDPINTYMSQTLPATLGMPVQVAARHVKTGSFALYPSGAAAYSSERRALTWVSIGFISNLESHIVLPEGRMPTDPKAGADAIEAIVSQELAEKVGLQVGETFVAFQRPDANQAASSDTAEARPAQVTVRITGVWKAKDASEDFWFYDPKTMQDLLLVTEGAFHGTVGDTLKKQVAVATWYYVFDGQAISADNANALLDRINRVNTQAGILLPHIALALSPADALESYRWTTFLMTLTLYVFAIPVLGVVLYFIMLISGLIVQRQQGEIAMLRSRGAGDLQVVGIYALEGLFTAIIAVIGGLFLAQRLAALMGDSISFLTLGKSQHLVVRITSTAVRMALLGAAVALGASLVPAWRAARLSIVAYYTERTRSLQRPLWQRYGLDLLLLIPAGYGYVLLRQRGSLNVITGQAGGDPYSNPLLFLVPSLAILALALLFMRLFPLFLRGLAWVTGRVLGGLAIVLALQQLARAQAVYSGALLLLVLTLSLATFSAAMARTLDRSLLDRELYRTGSDFLLSETGANTNWGNVADASASDGWVFVPVAEHLKVPGILAATRVGAYPVSVVSAGSGTQSATLYGIDRLDFPKAAFFRSDFSPESRGTLMNRLAVEPDAVLVSSNLLAEQQVGVGERVNVSIGVYGERRTLQFTIAGVINYFPTYYPADDNHYLLVGNLEYLFEQLGGLFPYDVWIKTGADLDPQTLQNDLFQHDINVVSIRGSQEAIAKERDRPERAGLFGMLSVGFVAATLLTVLGFLLHSLISFRRQSIKFGVLRAIGLTLWQMTAMLACEQFLLIVVGAGVGTGVGIWVSERFIPFLEVGTSALAQVPPFVVLNDWHDLLGLYALAAAMLAVAVGAMIGLLVRLRIFEMIKLGDAV